MTRDDINRMVREALNEVTTEERMSGDLTPMFERFAALVAAAAKAEEREACAKVCEEFYSIEGIAQRCAAAIRARGNK